MGFGSPLGIDGRTSTLFMPVSALMEIETMQAAYREWLALFEGDAASHAQRVLDTFAP